MSEGRRGRGGLRRLRTRLIAAAPEMLAALRALADARYQDALDFEREPEDQSLDRPERWLGAWDAAAAALAKAEGGEYRGPNPREVNCAACANTSRPGVLCEYHAAAPELLEALRDLVNDAGYVSDVEECECGIFEDVHRCPHTRARAAIAKAEGRV